MHTMVGGEINEISLALIFDCFVIASNESNYCK